MSSSWIQMVWEKIKYQNSKFQIKNINTVVRVCLVKPTDEFGGEVCNLPRWFPLYFWQDTVETFAKTYLKVLNKTRTELFCQLLCISLFVHVSVLLTFFNRLNFAKKAWLISATSSTETCPSRKMKRFFSTNRFALLISVLNPTTDTMKIDLKLKRRV